MNMNIFARPLGMHLTPREKQSFDNIKTAVDRCTDEILLQPDWGANLACCDAICMAPTQAVVNEAMAAVKRKFSSRSHNVVALSLHLTEAIVKNCGERAFRAINDDSFLKELGKVARKYNGKKHESSCREVLELCLDIIQAWGEAFLPRSREYPLIPKLYHDLRKDGLEFRAQYDESRVPVFSPPPVIPPDTNAGFAPHPQSEEDAIAAAMAASLADSGPPPDSTMDALGMSRANAEAQHARPAPSTSRSNSKASEVIAGCNSSMGILREIILNAASASELQDNEICDEIVTQLRVHQDALATAIEVELSGEGDGIEGLFKLNDDIALILQVYTMIQSGATPLRDGCMTLRALHEEEETVATTTTQTPQESSGDNLLDMFMSSPAPSNTKDSKKSVEEIEPVQYDMFGDVIRKPAATNIAQPSPPQLPSVAGQMEIQSETMGIFSMHPHQQGAKSNTTVPTISAPPATQPRVIRSERQNPTQLPPAHTDDIFGSVVLTPSRAAVGDSQTAPKNDDDPFSCRVSIDEIMAGGAQQPPAPPTESLGYPSNQPSSDMPSVSAHMQPQSQSIESDQQTQSNNPFDYMF
mmetsp:Transcript_23748/g.34821  ORF Transcript_23748/g.34821 Transcript_23748/m.34821 type:complete len:584 (-) Transcript_23748:194-1945(-)